MNLNIPAALRRVVLERAGNRCEYCQLSQAGQEATFHIDQVVPVAAGGPTIESNLALACVSCSLREGSALTAENPETGQRVPIFNPRVQRWAEYFRWQGSRLIGITPTGRATVTALSLNRSAMLAIRDEEGAFGSHPSP